MRILAIDTSLAACSAAVLDDGALLAHRYEHLGRGHAEALMPMIEDVRTAAGLEYAALDLIAVSVGPGTFTGVRVGVAAARALSLAANVPARGFTSLHILAAGAVQSGAAGPMDCLVAAIDAKRGEVYVQSFGPKLSPYSPPELCSLDDAAAGAPTGPGWIVGTGSELLHAHLAKLGSALAVSAAPDQPDAKVLAHIAAERAGPGKGASTGPVQPVRPLYLRAPDARLP